MTDVLLTQDIVEILRTEDAGAALTQTVVEILRSSATGPTHAEISQMVVEVLIPYVLSEPEIEFENAEPSTVPLTWLEWTDRADVTHTFAKVGLPDAPGYYHGFKEK